MLRKAATLIAALAVFIAAPLSAQSSPTPENTVITNSISVAYQDAEGNAYTATASVSVTVGFLAGVDVQSNGTVTPASPSTGNQLVFTIVNDGNGTDQFSVNSATVGGGSGVSITGYIFNSTNYATLTLLNAALAAANVTAGSSVAVTVVYDVSVPGGETRTISLTAGSIRTPAETDASTTSVTPPVAGGVSITANTPTVSRLPNNTTATYSTTFLVANGANASKTFTLTPSVSGGAAILIANVTVNGGNDQLTVAANASATVTVTYIVANVAAGTSTTVTLAVADNAAPLTVNDSDTHVVTVIKPALNLEKAVFRVDQITAITASDRVLPGEDIYYRLTITNGGTAAATTLSLTDALPAQVLYVSNSAPGTWTVLEASGTVTATTASLAISASNVIWIRVTVR